MPKSVVKTQVEYGTIPAMLPSKNTPSDMIRTEFLKGTEPTEVSPRFDTLNNVKILMLQEMVQNKSFMVSC